MRRVLPILVVGLVMLPLVAAAGAADGGEVRLVGAQPNAVLDGEVLLVSANGGFLLSRMIGGEWQAADVVEEFPAGYEPQQFTAVDGGRLIVFGDYGYNQPTVIQALVQRGAKWYIEQTIDTGEYLGEVRLDRDRFVAVRSVSQQEKQIVVYERTGSQSAPWTRVAVIPQPDDVGLDPNESDRYGMALALQGGEIFVGAHGQDGARGAVYVFQKTSSGWVQRQKIVGPVAGGGFGVDLDVDGKTMAVGARWENGTRGAVRIYRKSGSLWYHRQHISGQGGEFGFDLDLHGDILVVGAPVEPNEQSYKGQVYQYVRNASGTFEKTRKYRLPSDLHGNYFGQSVTTNGWAIVATLRRTSGPQSLAAFSIGPQPVLCRGYRVTITGKAGDAEIRGTRRSDVILGTGGDDVITSLGGHDVVCAGRGDDLVVLGGGNDLADGGPGADSIRGGSGDDVLLGEAGRDQLEGGSGDDTLDGGSSRDTAMYDRASHGIELDLTTGISEGHGRDTLTGVESIVGTSYNDKIWGDGDINVIRGLGGYDVIRGSSGDDYLYGGGDGDTVYGGGGDDTIAGGWGDDWLDGESGDDTIDGGRGFDRCEGFATIRSRCEGGT